MDIALPTPFSKAFLVAPMDNLRGVVFHSALPDKLLIAIGNSTRHLEAVKICVSFRDNVKERLESDERRRWYRKVSFAMNYICILFMCDNLGYKIMIISGSVALRW